MVHRVRSGPKVSASSSYNQRIFESRNLRSWVHNARFLWFRRVSAQYLPDEVRAVELGCFDGRLLSYFPQPPIEYWGFDADWDGGLAMAQQKYAERPNWRFAKATEPTHLAQLPSDHFDAAVALETLEHVPHELVDPYLAELARVTRGHLFVSVPNEKGLVFLAKYLAKTACYGSTQHYTPTELACATMGLMSRVERDDHKGFDYDWLRGLVAKHFDIVAIGGLPLDFLPPIASVTVTIVAKSRR